MRINNLPQEFKKALPVIDKLNQAGYEACFVGGSVRDCILNLPIHDVDIATSAFPAEIKEVFEKTIDVGIEHGTVLVLHQDESYEITTFRTESTYQDYRRPDHVDFVRSLEEDLKRRDFTINALALNAQGQIIDLFHGLEDLQNKRLKAVGIAAERFQEDALRMMRGLRFVSQLGFDLEEKEIKDKIIYVSGFSKIFSMTGLRIGYVACIEKYMKEIIKVHQYGVSCAPSIAQYGALSGLRNSLNDVENMRKTFERRKNYCMKRLRELNLEVAEPKGAFYIFPSIKKSSLLCLISIRLSFYGLLYLTSIAHKVI